MDQETLDLWEIVLVRLVRAIEIIEASKLHEEGYETLLQKTNEQLAAIHIYLDRIQKSLT